jgi:hypothetical protein
MTATGSAPNGAPAAAAHGRWYQGGGRLYVILVVVCLPMTVLQLGPFAGLVSALLFSAFLWLLIWPAWQRLKRPLPTQLIQRFAWWQVALARILASMAALVAAGFRVLNDVVLNQVLVSLATRNARER